MLVLYDLKLLFIFIYAGIPNWSCERPQEHLYVILEVIYIIYYKNILFIIYIYIYIYIYLLYYTNILRARNL